VSVDVRDLDEATVDAMWSRGGRRHTTVRLTWSGFRFVLARARLHSGGDVSAYLRRMLKFATLHMPPEYE
jgi:hypothetical protein